MWDYTTTFGLFDESFLMAPLVSGSTVTGVITATRIKDKVYFKYSTDIDAIVFFQNLLFPRNSKIHAENQMQESSKLVCSSRTYTMCFPDDFGDNCQPPTTVTTCIEINESFNEDPNGGGFDDGFIYDGGFGGGGGTNPSPKDTNIVDPCEKIKLQITSAEYIKKIEELDKSSVLNQKKETGYSESKSGVFSPLQTSLSSSSADGLKLPINSDTKGFMHTHLNDYEDGTIDEDGNPRERRPIRMFSPADVNALMELAKLQADGDYSQLYATMVSSYGNYTIKFTGTPTDIKNGFDTKLWRDDYTLFMKSEKGSLEKRFLRFLSEKMGIKSVSLFKITDNGEIKNKILDANKKVQSTDCL